MMTGGNIMEASGVIHFDGTSNILTCSAYKDGPNGCVGVLHFSKNVSQLTMEDDPVFGKDPFHEAKRDAGELVTMLFEKTESIDVIIRQLEVIKKHMEESDGSRQT
jgi:hypothetical protein